MNNKYIIKSKSDFKKWLDIANLFAKSLCPRDVVLQQFNALSSSRRNEIKKKFADCDITRRKKIPKGESDEAWVIGIMVDAHIIAFEYDIDPLTAIICVNPICKSKERIIIK